MTRHTGRPRAGTAFLGSVDRRYRGPWQIGGNPVSGAAFRRAHCQVFGGDVDGRWPIARGAGIRGRKRALDARRAWKGCEHDLEYREDTIGDYGVVNGTYTERWLECASCGAQRPASWEDAPSYEDF